MQGQLLAHAAHLANFLLNIYFFTPGTKIREYWITNINFLFFNNLIDSYSITVSNKFVNDRMLH